MWRARMARSRAVTTWSGSCRPFAFMEARVLQAELAGALVEQVGESRLRARDPFGDDDRRVVARLHDQAAQQVAHRHARN